MSINSLSFYPRVVFMLSTIITIILRMLGIELIALIFTPFLTLTLIYDYHITVRKDQTLYFISALMAYWGASILFCIALNRELEEPLIELLKKWKYIIPLLVYGIYYLLLMYFIKPYLKELFIPIIIYSATLSFAAALSIIVYLRRKTKSIAYFTAGLVLLSITASLIGVNLFYLESDFLHGVETLLYAPTLYLLFLYFKTKTNHEF